MDEMTPLETVVATVTELLAKGDNIYLQEGRKSVPLTSASLPNVKRFVRDRIAELGDEG